MIINSVIIDGDDQDQEEDLEDEEELAQAEF